MRIMTFNVNGLRARIKAGWPRPEFLEELNADIICLQEVRANEKQIPSDFLRGYVPYPSIHAKAGYAGAWIFVRDSFGGEPGLFLDEVPGDETHETGRAAILDFRYFKVINSYTPNSGSRLEKIANRKHYEHRLLEYITDAADYKPIILCGDLNVAPAAIDTNIKCQAGTSPAERQCFAKYSEIGFCDLWRELHPTLKQYTFFSNMYAAREENKGMRLDHFVIPRKLIPQVAACDILHDYTAGSDHTPVLLDIDI